jgi:hypothetical protein
MPFPDLHATTAACYGLGIEATFAVERVEENILRKSFLRGARSLSWSRSKAVWGGKIN